MTITKKMLADLPFTRDEVWNVFQSTAEAVGGDILQCCLDCGEDPVIERDGLWDYLTMYGGDKDAAERICKWSRTNGLTWEQQDRVLTRLGVPKTWA